MKLFLPTIVTVIAMGLFAQPSSLLAHGKNKHDAVELSVSDAVDIDTANAINSQALKNIGGSFSLIDHNGNTVTEAAFAEKHMLVFFGYVDCQMMCPISLTRIGQALTLLEQQVENLSEIIVPLVVTVDPDQDTPEKMRVALENYHPALIGLTGSARELQVMYEAYKQKPSLVDMPMNDKAVVSHTSYFYLMGPDGEFKTLFPPILNPESMANIIKKYI